MNGTSFLRNVWLVGRGVLLETARRKEFWVLSIFAFAFVLGVIAVRLVGIDNPETAAFVVNLGLSLALGAAHLLTILTAARQLPSELENRTIYPILAKPVDRFEYLLGKWWACTAAGMATMALLSAIAWLPAPTIEGASAATLAQAVVAGALSLAVASAMVLLLSLLMPQSANIVASALIVWFGDKAAGFAAARAAETALAAPVRWIAGYVPDFSRLNLVTRYTDAVAPLGAAEMAGLALYATVLLAACQAAAHLLFRKRPI